LGYSELAFEKKKVFVVAFLSFVCSDGCA